MKIRFLDAPTDQDWASLREMWRDLYKIQKSQGMRVKPPANADQLWEDSLKPTLGRLAWLHVAEENGKILGFVAARTRTLPKYFGQAYVGFISDVYVRPEHQGKGLGRELVEHALEHYRANGISRVELQVMLQNESARELYRKLGFEDELLQMVREL